MYKRKMGRNFKGMDCFDIVIVKYVYIYIVYVFSFFFCTFSSDNWEKIRTALSLLFLAFLRQRGPFLFVKILN